MKILYKLIIKNQKSPSVIEDKGLFWFFSSTLLCSVYTKSFLILDISNSCFPLISAKVSIPE